MAIQIEVMYYEPDKATLNRWTKNVRRDVRLAGTLKKTNVLYVILSATTTAARARVTLDGVPKERVGSWSSVIGDGNVSQDVCVMARRGDDFCLRGVDDPDWLWIPESDPLGPASNRIPDTYTDVPLDEAVYFYGVKADPAVAVIARTFFDESMH